MCDVLGQVYEYFLSHFANAEGKRGGQFYIPESVVRVLVEILRRDVRTKKFVESHQGRYGDISIR